LSKGGEVRSGSSSAAALSTSGTADANGHASGGFLHGHEQLQSAGVSQLRRSVSQRGEGKQVRLTATTLRAAQWRRIITGAHCFPKRRLFFSLVSVPALAASAVVDPSLPRHWEPMDTTHGNKHLVHLTKEKHPAELAEVEQHWQLTNGNGHIVSVHRIQNSALHRRFAKARQCTPGVTEQLTYHGTRSNVPSSIYASRTGFDMSRGLHQPGSVATPLTLGRL